MGKNNIFWLFYNVTDWEWRELQYKYNQWNIKDYKYT